MPRVTNPRVLSVEFWKTDIFLPCDRTCGILLTAIRGSAVADRESALRSSDGFASAKPGVSGWAGKVGKLPQAFEIAENRDGDCHCRQGIRMSFGLGRFE